EVALAGEAAEVTTPRDDVHLQPRRVRELHERDLVGRDRPDRSEWRLAREDVEAVEGQSNRWMVGPAYHLPGVAVVVDVAAPGQRLEAEPDAALGSAFAEFVEIGGGAVDATLRVGCNVAANHHQVAAELAHQIEFAFGPRECARPLRLRHAFEIAEWLERDDLEAERADQPRDVARRAVEGEKIALEQFHADEASRGGRLKLFGQSTAQRNGRD